MAWASRPCVAPASRRRLLGRQDGWRGLRSGLSGVALAKPAAKPPRRSAGRSGGVACGAQRSNHGEYRTVADSNLAVAAPVLRTCTDHATRHATLQHLETKEIPIPDLDKPAFPDIIQWNPTCPCWRGVKLSGRNRWAGLLSAPQCLLAAARGDIANLRPRPRSFWRMRTRFEGPAI